MNNPHFDWLKRYRNAGNTLAPTVEATLALTYEQRTANLISFLEHAEGDTYQDNWQQIATRLGLGDTK